MIGRIVAALAVTMAGLTVSSPAEARSCGDNYRTGYSETQPPWGNVKQWTVARRCTQNDGSRVLDLVKGHFEHDDCGPVCITFDVDHVMTYRVGDRQLTVARTTQDNTDSVEVDLSGKPDWPLKVAWTGWYHWNVFGADTEGSHRGGF